MNRLVFIVEGDCEEYLVNKKIIPYLYQHITNGSQWAMNAQKIVTNRKKNARGGNVSYQYLKADIERTSKQNEGNTYITTFMDFFRLPNDFPGYETSDINKIEESVKEDNKGIKLIPYIQKYEFETLLFSNRDALEAVIDDDKGMKEIDTILSKYPNIEDINSSPDNAPSKRLGRIFHYNKTADSSIVLDFIDMNEILAKCPRFSDWIKQLTTLLNK